MSQANELLNSLTEEELAAYGVGSEIEEHIIIDNNRRITVPAKLKRIAVETDHNIETVIFDCPRYWDEHDLSTFAVYINYTRSDGYEDCYPVNDITVEEDTMHFSWTISRNVTSTSGSITFSVCAKKTNSEGEETHHWNTEICTDMYVSKGLEVSEQWVGQTYDIVTQFILRLGDIDAALDHILELQNSILEG